MLRGKHVLGLVLKEAEKKKCHKNSQQRLNKPQKSQFGKPPPEFDSDTKKEKQGKSQTLQKGSDFSRRRFVGPRFSLGKPKN